MLNMKKLIDETDFDNLGQVTKSWKQTSQPSTKNHVKPHSVCKKQPIYQQNQEKQNNSYISNELRDMEQQVDLMQPSKNIVPQNTMYKKRNVVPQVIDQDTEHFKNKLEHLLNNFKVDAVSQFMGMKREMLDYQKECVKNDTHKYLTMYEQKHQQLLQTKQKLLSASRQAQKKTKQVQLLSEHIGKLNNRLRAVQYLSMPFAVLYQNKERQKMQKFKLNQAKIYDQKRLKRKSLNSWMNQFKDIKKLKTQQQNQERVQSEVNEIVGRFQKQMDMLKAQLQEATRKNQEYQNNKVVLQDNLKKAFLRGVTAMNMEAMGVLGDNPDQQQWLTNNQDHNRTTRTNKQSSIVGSNMSFVDKTRNYGDSSTDNHSMYVTKNKQSITNSQINYDNRNSEVMMFSQPKSQSKNHKWKEAPIMGVQQKMNQQEPRMQVVRPTTQGKVIKVVDGRSAVENKKSLHNDSRQTASRRKN